MQAALPLNKPVPVHSLGVAALLLTVIVVSPSKVPVVSNVKLGNPEHNQPAGEVFWANQALKLSMTESSLKETLLDKFPAERDITKQLKPENTSMDNQNMKVNTDESVNLETTDKETKNLNIEQARARFIQHALSWQGVSYLWGGNSRIGIDCSALVQRIYQSVGILLPRTSYEQFRVGVGVAKQNLLPGDLVFFSTGGYGASHVGIYLGGGDFLSATRRQVEIQSMDLPYWKSTYRGSRRVSDFTFSVPQSQLPS